MHLWFINKCQYQTKLLLSNATSNDSKDQGFDMHIYTYTHMHMNIYTYRYIYTCVACV